MPPAITSDLRLTVFPQPPIIGTVYTHENLGGHHAWGSAWSAGHRRRGVRSPRRSDRPGWDLFV